MAPSKVVPKPMTSPGGGAKYGIKTRSQHSFKDGFTKRKADESPLKRLTVKRTTLGDFTNAHHTEKENTDVPRGKAIFDNTALLNKFAKPCTKKTALQDVKTNDLALQIKEKASNSLLNKENPSKSIPVLMKQSSLGEVKSAAQVGNSGESKHIPVLKKQISLPDVLPGQTIKENAGVLKMKQTVKKQTSLDRIGDKVSMPVAKENCKIKPVLKKQISLPKMDEKLVRKPLATQNTNNVQTELKVPKKPTEPKPVQKRISKLQENLPPPGVVTRRSLRKSAELEKTNDSSLYVSALEELNLDDSARAQIREKQKKKAVKPPPGVDDYDKEQVNDLYSVSIYAMDIFNYLKSKEERFTVENYMARQKDLTCNMRALLVDWMVEVQENYELNHETLYLGVKLVDLYLSKEIIKKENLQLVACASFFVAAKYDERIPPSIEDFIYVCDDLYSRKDLTNMENKLLKVVDFQLGIPLSYRFLRRYARCAKINLEILTLARFILEFNLMNYATITYSDSKIAAAALLMALLMTKRGKWSPTLEYYTGYKVSDFIHICHELNSYLVKDNLPKLKTIRTKYSHRLFFEVAKTPLLENFDDAV